MSIEAWVTELDGSNVVHLERSKGSPFRRFRFLRELGGSGGGSLEYHLDNDLVRAHDDLFAFGKLVWMRYRDRVVAWVIEERHPAPLDEGEHESDWTTVAGRGTRQLLGDRIIWPTEFSEATTNPLLWGLGGWRTKTDGSAAVSQRVVPVVSTVGASVGIPVRITGGGHSQLGIVESIVVGVSVTLEDDLAFTFPVGSRVVGATEQWRRFVNRAAGEMIWDLISESNPRFEAQIVRGTVETTGADGWTQDLRFDNLLDDVAADVEAKFGDVEVEGLTYHYRNAQGNDRTGEVILEEGADLTSLKFEENDRDSLSWVVTEGTGEAVYAKLQPKEKPTRTTRKTPAKRTPVRRKAPEVPAKVELIQVEYPVFYTEEAHPVRRRREAYVDDKGHATETELDDTGRAVLEEHVIADAVAFEANETRYRAFVDYDLGDLIRIIAPSRGADENVRIVALACAEHDDDTVKVGAEVNTPSQEHLLRLKAKADKTASSVGVRNRQPQGQLVPFPFSGQGVFDQDDTLEVHFWIPDRLHPITEAMVALDLRPFFASAKTLATSGTLTSDSGGGSTTVSGGGSTSGSGGSSSPTSTTDDIAWTNSSINHTHGGGATNSPSLTAITAVNGLHSHTVTIGSHTHTTPAHTHATPDHQHTVAGHTHAIVYGVFKETYPVSHSVTVKVYEWYEDVWTLRATLPGYTADREEIDLLPYITGPGQWRLDLVSAAAQPNGGRLGAYVSGYVTAAMQSA